MATLTIPNTFVTLTTISENAMNSNFSAIASWALNIDNTNIGSVGIFASQIMFASTLHGTMANSSPFTVSQTTAGQTALIVTSASTPTVDIAQFQIAGTTVLSVDSNGALVFKLGSSYLSSAVTIVNDQQVNPGLLFNVPANPTKGIQFQFHATTYMALDAGAALSFYAGSALTNTNVSILNDSATFNGMLLNVPTSSTNGIRCQIGGTTYLQVTGSGAVVLPGQGGSIASTAVGFVNDSGTSNGLIFNVPAASTSGYRFQIGGTGVLQIDTGGALSFFSGTSLISANVSILNDSAATNGMQFNVGTGSTNGFRFSVNGTPLLRIEGGGALTFLSGSTLTSANVSILNDSAATNGMLLNVPASSTNGIRCQLGGTTYLQVTGSGAVVIPGQGGSIASSAVGFVNDSGTSNGLIFNVPAASTSGFRFQIGGTPFLRIEGGGALTFLSGSTLTSANVSILNDSAAIKGMQFNVPTSSTNAFRFSEGGVVFGQIIVGAGTTMSVVSTSNNLCLQSTGAAGAISFGVPGNITAYGYVTTGGYTAPSSRSLKRDIGPAQIDSLALVDRLDLRSFRWMSLGDDSPLAHGFVADEVPDEIRSDIAGDATGWNTSVALAIALDAIKRLSAKVAVLEGG